KVFQDDAHQDKTTEPPWNMETLTRGEAMDEGSIRTSGRQSIFVGNLNPDFSKELLCYMLKDLIAAVGVVLQRRDIEVFKKHKRAHAFIRVKKTGEFQAILDELQNPAILELANMKDLVVRGKTLNCSPAAGSKREAASARRRPEAGQGLGVSLLGARLALWPSRLVDRMATPLMSTKSDSAIIGGEISGQERLFFGEQMGSETRNVEFKRGGGEYMNIALKHHIRKYVCAFLNSEGGSLFVGVNDDGTVCGVECTHKDEDRVRLMADSVLKGFRPPLFPGSYSIHFLPVVKDGHSGLFLKVMRLTVQIPKKEGDVLLYETDQGEVYVRRDGSVQGPLSGSSIQEWCRQKWTAEIKKLQDKMDHLVREEQYLQEKLRRKQQSIVELQQNQQDMQVTHSGKATVSHLCCVM
uniref:Schlafen AlbA-2 domain-containing protein n=1 Tax=Callorhinchus milii TaxID=7868 RepID=A0A4W3JKT1_CALMI